MGFYVLGEIIDWEDDFLNNMTKWTNEKNEEIMFYRVKDLYKLLIKFIDEGKNVENILRVLLDKFYDVANSDEIITNYSIYN